MKLNDQSQMPFGKYHGKLMGDVPADYLLWLWDDAELWDEEAVKKERFDSLGRKQPGNERHAQKRLAVRDYIIESFSALETECTHRIITHRP